MRFGLCGIFTKYNISVWGFKRVNEKIYTSQKLLTPAYKLYICHTLFIRHYNKYAELFTFQISLHSYENNNIISKIFLFYNLHNNVHTSAE